jgi:hypothetical protein
MSRQRSWRHHESRAFIIDSASRDEIKQQTKVPRKRVNKKSNNGMRTIGGYFRYTKKNSDRNPWKRIILRTNVKKQGTKFIVSHHSKPQDPERKRESVQSVEE